MRKPGRKKRKARALARAAHRLGDLAFCMVNTFARATPGPEAGGHWCTRGGMWTKWKDGQRSRMAHTGFPVYHHMETRLLLPIDRSAGSARTRFARWRKLSSWAMAWSRKSRVVR